MNVVNCQQVSNIIRYKKSIPYRFLRNIYCQVDNVGRDRQRRSCLLKCKRLVHDPVPNMLLYQILNEHIMFNKN